MQVFISGVVETEALKTALRKHAMQTCGEERIATIKVLMRVIRCEELQDLARKKKTANHKGQR